MTQVVPHQKQNWLMRVVWPRLDGSLVDSPQRWGFLPTRAYWRRLDVKKAGFPIVGGLLLPPLILFLATGLLFKYPIAVFSGFLVAEVVVCGLLERYIRRKARERLAIEARDADMQPLPSGSAE